MRWMLLLSCAAATLASFVSAAEPGELPEYQKREFPVPGGEPLKYVVYVPKDLSADRPVPLLLYLHGSSADCVTHERIMKESDLLFWHAYGRDVQREPTILVAPVGGRGGWTNQPRETAILGILDGLIEEFPVDKRRIYLQGFSMGGAGTWHLLQKRPGFFAAANPQGAGSRNLDPQLVKDTPIWATIGDQDRSVSRVTANVAAIRAANGDPRGGLTQVTGVNPRFTIFPNTSHGGAQGGTQRIPGFMDWMYAQVNDGNLAPTVRFVEPALDSASENGTVKAAVTASDPEGKLARVEFYRGDEKVHAATGSPFEFTYSDLPVGPHVLKATAVDAGGKSRTAELTVRVAGHPLLHGGDRVLFVGGRQLGLLERRVSWSLDRAAEPLKVSGETRLYPDASLSQMAEDKHVTDAIKSSPARFAVMAAGQAQDGNPSVEDMAKFVDLLRGAGKIPVVVMTWARNPAGREEFRRSTEQIVGQVQELQKQRDVLVMPCGLILYDLTVDPPPALAGQREDYAAQSELGMVACVASFYAVTTGRSPVGLPMEDDLDPAAVRAVEERVWRIVQDWEAGKVVIKPVPAPTD